MARTKLTPSQINNGAQTNTVATTQSTTSTTFTDLTTAGPSVTVSIGANGQALIALSCDMANNTANAYTVVGVAISGANTIAPADTLVIGSLPAAAELNIGTVYLLTGLTPGSTTFKLQYRVTGGTGNFLSRKISVIPL